VREGDGGDEGRYGWMGFVICWEWRLGEGGIAGVEMGRWGDERYVYIC